MAITTQEGPAQAGSSKARRLAYELAEQNGMEVGGWTLTPTQDGGAVVSITLRPSPDQRSFDQFMRETGARMFAGLPARNARLEEEEADRNLLGPPKGWWAGSGLSD